MTTDSLRDWLDVRASIDWRQQPEPREAGPPGRDGFTHYLSTVVRRRSAERADRMLAALEQVRSDAASGRDLNFAMLAGWQRIVLGVPEVGFRQQVAYAKGGRERYGITESTPVLFETLLAESMGDEPLAARAGRAYLDVCFFHPFADGNARAALLTLAFVLARDGVVPARLGAVPVVDRRASSPESAVELVRLIHWIA